jgi:hypothetical protein
MPKIKTFWIKNKTTMSPILFFFLFFYFQKKFIKLKFLFDSLLITESKLLLSIILIDTLNFLKTIKIKKPKANSKPANPNIKNVLENMFKSSK